MIEDISASILIHGERFSPNQAEKITGLELQDKMEVGDIASKGRYKGKAIPYGSGLLVPPKHIDMFDRMMWLVKALDGKIDQLKEIGADEPNIHIGYFYKNQCNLVLSKEELTALAKLEIDFSFSCYDVSDEE